MEFARILVHLTLGLFCTYLELSGWAVREVNPDRSGCSQSIKAKGKSQESAFGRDGFI
jgi:hypothetical protein